MNYIKFYTTLLWPCKYRVCTTFDYNLAIFTELRMCCNHTYKDRSGWLSPTTRTKCPSTGKHALKLNNYLSYIIVLKTRPLIWNIPNLILTHYIISDVSFDSKNKQRHGIPAYRRCTCWAILKFSSWNGQYYWRITWWFWFDQNNYLFNDGN